MRKSVARWGSWSLLLACAGAANAIEVDGRIAPGEYDGATHVTDFRLVQPLSRAPAPYPTEAWVLSTPEGLAIGFRNTQPANVPRTRQESQRDAGGPVDRVNLYVDFDGDGRAGYNFTVTLADGIIDTTINNENQFNGDWDGNWQHATSEDGDTWSAEMLIPWHIAPMQAATGDKRTIGLSLDRVIGSTNERMAWPAVTFTEPRFLTVFEKLEIPQHSQSLFAITPFVVGVYDNVGHDGQFDGGADIFWKPNGQFQLTATLNPDFGQVESDQLVVNFSAIETFFSDKRPFFTENQAFFDVPFGSLNNANRLIYTRRVGDGRDGGGDVIAALKVNGSAGGFNYGVFAATEDDEVDGLGNDLEVGRDFYVLRGTRDFAAMGLGAMFTRVDRPDFNGSGLDKTADVWSLDHRWTPKPGLDIRSAFVESDITVGGSDSVRDSGAQVRIEHDLGKGLRQQLYVLHLGGDLDLNDFGFLERNNFNYARYEVARRVTDLPESSKYSSHQWRYATSVRYNDDGRHLWDAIAMNRQSEFRNGGNQFWEVAAYGPGYDDLITRGHGDLRIPAKYFAFAERYWPRRSEGHWEFYGNARYAVDGIRGWDKPSLETYLEPSYHVNDRLRFFAGVTYKKHPDWLIWSGDASVATPGAQAMLVSYDSDLLILNAGMTWLIDPKQELRIRLEDIGLDARAINGWDLAANGEPIENGAAVDDFEVRNLGFQVRYRREIAPLSYLYIAYVRGGSLYDQEMNSGFDAGDSFARAFELRDSEQLLVKLSYRFEM